MSGFREVAPNVYVLDPQYGPDTQAVMGAKSSRAPDLKARWTEMLALLPEGQKNWDYSEPPAPVAKFIDQNLGDYGHSSIAELAGGCWVHVRGFGWPSAWLIEDFPLFVGQEVSTRAVDPTQLPGICDYCPEEFTDLHDRWTEVFRAERDREAGKRGYKFDEVRWALPGSIRAGVTMQTQARNAIMHLRDIQGLLPDLADRFLKGYAACAPTVTKHYAKGPKNPPSIWTKGTLCKNHPLNLDLASSISVTDEFRVMSNQMAPYISEWPDRPAPRHYADPIWERFPRFGVGIFCSVAVARDWHRHRPIMPWTIEPVVSGGSLVPMAGYPGMAAWLETDEGKALWADTSKVFLDWSEKHAGTTDWWQGLHALPFGAMVHIKAVGTLPKILYMLELRATTRGANFEYKAQAISGLRQFAHLIGPTLDARLKVSDAVTLAEQVEIDNSVELELV
tara:strand:+ start:755 stop:2104 length:1350 start_codon:yes stop_codon:yes gene_type:complete